MKVIRVEMTHDNGLFGGGYLIYPPPSNHQSKWDVYHSDEKGNGNYIAGFYDLQDALNLVGALVRDSQFSSRLQK